MQPLPGKRWHTREDSGIRLDASLRWWHDDEPVLHPRIIEIFNTSLVLDEQGRYQLRIGNDWCFVQVEDAAYEVRCVDVTPDERLSIRLSDRTAEALDVSTLAVGTEGILTCRVKGGPEDDANLQALIESQAPVCTIFGKTWTLHVTDVLLTTLEDNLRIIEQSVAFLRAAGRRVIYDDGRFLVVAPYASCFPFELRLFPYRHGHDFALQDDADLDGCAAALRNVLRRLRNLLRDPPFNFILHTAPPMQPRPEHPDYWSTLAFDYHWHIELVPRLSRIAGFEWGSGFFINLMPPEDAARFLRGTDPDSSF